MSKYFLTAFLCVVLVSGCAGSSGGESASPAEAPAVQNAPAPEAQAPATKDAKKKDKKKDKKKAGKEQKHHAKSEAAIREELNLAAKRLVSRASRTITPSKSSKAVSQSGNGYVARYIHIDPAKYSTDMRPASKPGQYVGFVRYTEQTYQCRGKTRKEALSAPCTPASSRRLNEMIHYDGSAWRD